MKITISATTRIALCISMLVLFFMLLAYTLGLIPDPRVEVVHGRLKLCESIAVTCSQYASRNELKRAQALLQVVVERNPDLLSAGLRKPNGALLVQYGDHANKWIEGESTGDTHCKVPIVRGRKRWGQAELLFAPVHAKGFSSWMGSQKVQLIIFMVFACFVGSLVFLRKVLRQLNPTKVIPARVKTAFDTLTNGLILVDKNERIVMANQAFANAVGKSPEKLTGLKASTLNWRGNNDEDEKSSLEFDLPWLHALDRGVSQVGTVLRLQGTGDQAHTFLVNSAPIMGDGEDRRGALASFEDVTELIKKKNELIRMLQVLRESREQIRRQNSELQLLATRDTLTGCMNRRSLFTEFETAWDDARKQGFDLSVLMIDVDHFKSVNDTHGHSKGDEVLKAVAQVLRTSAGKCDVVARFGGEEFCVLLPRQDIEDARKLGEKIRQAIESGQPGGLSITASIGASTLTLGATDQQGLLDEADKCLYVAKRSGRNQVVCWSDVDDDYQFSDGAESSTKSESTTEIPFHAVTALISALGYRHTDTAEHSRRVADFAVAVGRTMMSVHETYILEISALLHDIGKVGVPDSILLKPGPLTEAEWQVMRDHDRIGVEIVRSTFECHELSTILRTHNAWYSGKPDDPSQPRGEEIPLSARILSICDAYDAMISDRVYRRGMTQEDAFEELRRCASSQFDPNLVETFIEIASTQQIGQVADMNDVSKTTAIKIGQQIEQLAEVLDNHDVESLGILSRRLAHMATQSGIGSIASLATEISETVDQNPDLPVLIELTNDLIELCRATQGAYLQGVSDHVDFVMAK